MLERFKVPVADQVRVSEPSLRRTTTALFEKVGVPHEDAVEGANTLVMSDLRGVESHGVSNMLRRYLQDYTDGTLNPRPNWRVVRESPATAVTDADGGLAVILGPKAMRLAIKKARAVGVGVVTMYNSGHSGAVGHHAMLAARQDMVGMCMTAVGNSVPPTFGAEGRFGTNPFSIAAPARKEPFFLFDGASTVVAGNKLSLARRVGTKLLPGWIADKNGVPIMEETPVPETGEYMQLLLGGTREQGSHKGYGLAMMSEILACLLSGAIPSMLDSLHKSKTYFAAYNISAFTDLDGFKDTMDQMLSTLKSTRPAPGHQRVIYPGLSEHEEERERRARGIPLHKEVVEWFGHITSELSVPPLETVRL